MVATFGKKFGPNGAFGPAVIDVLDPRPLKATMLHGILATNQPPTKQGLLAEWNRTAIDVVRKMVCARTRNDLVSTSSTYLVRAKQIYTSPDGRRKRHSRPSSIRISFVTSHESRVTSHESRVRTSRVRTSGGEKDAASNEQKQEQRAGQQQKQTEEQTPLINTLWYGRYQYCPCAHTQFSLSLFLSFSLLSSLFSLLLYSQNAPSWTDIGAHKQARTQVRQQGNAFTFVSSWCWVGFPQTCWLDSS